MTLFAGDLFEAIPFGDQPTMLHRADDGKHFVGEVAFAYGLLTTPTCDMAGRDDAAKFFQNIASTWGEFGLEIDDVVASGDRVCMIGRAGGTIDGRQANYGFVHAWALRDGVCVRFDEYVDPTQLTAV